jgi:hypothetical protein
LRFGRVDDMRLIADLTLLILLMQRRTSIEGRRRLV